MATMCERAGGGPDYRESPSPHYQQIIADDPKAAPDIFREYAEAGLLLGEVSRDAYVCPQFASSEKDRMWSRVWQFACREEQIPEPGDCLVYDSPGASILIVRGDDGEIRAFYNSCPHRGMQLCAQDTSVAQITCPFHSIKWNLDGSVFHVPARWDFPGVAEDALRLIAIRVETWQGFVFINRDPSAPPLENYLGRLVPHFDEWRYDDKYVAAIMRRPMDANWKTCIEAFLEAYHLSGIHPQALPFGGEASTQYDVWPGEPHVSRFLEPVGLASDQIGGDLSEQGILSHAVRTVYGNDAVAPQLAEGQKARLFLAESMRMTYGEAHGRDYSGLSDAEAADAVQYNLFPNMVIFRSLAYPFVYRFLPLRDNPEKALFEFWVFRPRPAEGQALAPRIVDLDAGQSFAEAGVLPLWQAKIYDQDADGLRLCQQGLRNGGNMPVRFTRYQESRIRLLHHTLASYLSSS